MSKYIFCLSCTLLFFIQSCTSTMESKIDDLVQMYMDKNLFSGVVLYAEKGEIQYNKAFGYADHEHNIKNTINTKFNIGSLNKDFTTVIILQLCADDSLSLDKPIGNYMDGLSKDVLNTVTIRQIIRHEAGFSDYGFNTEYQNNPKKFDTVDKLMELVRQENMLFKPGTNHYYSNSGFIVLGKIIENVTHQSFGEVLKERIFSPLNMNDTLYNNFDEIKNRATGYIISATGKLRDASEFEGPASPAGGCYSTTGDLFKFYNSLKNTNLLLNDTYKQKMYTNVNEKIRMPWSKISSDESFFTAKAGGLEGFNSIVIEWLAREEVTIVLANYDEPIAEDVGMGVFSIMKDLEPDKPVIPAGQYVYKLLQEKGYEYLSAHYDSLMDINNYQYDDQWLLNQVGYDLLHEDKSEQAIQIFKLNVQRFPDEANPYDSLGEAYMNNGQNEKAIENFKKSLKIDPEKKHSKEMLSKLLKDRDV
ncbi:MAG: serine hydrolase [Calditrichaceae bacterium]